MTTITNYELSNLVGKIVALRGPAEIFRITHTDIMHYGKISQWDERVVKLNPCYNYADAIVEAGQVIRTMSAEDSQNEEPSAIMRNAGYMLRRQTQLLNQFLCRLMEIQEGSTSREKTFQRREILSINDFFGKR